MDKDELQNEADFSLEEDPEATTSTGADLAVKLKKVRSELKICQKERSEYLSGWQRAKADYLNLKKEGDSFRRESSLRAREAVFSDLFGLADSFEQAFSNREAWAQAPENWRLGVEYIYHQLQAIFRDHGIIEIDPPPGSKFNHHEHDSVGTVHATTAIEDDLVDETLKKGYKLGERVLRPAHVKVKHWLEPK